LISADVLTIAGKDLRLAMRRRSIVAALVLFPLVVALGLPLVLAYVGGKAGGIPASILARLLNSFVFFFVIGAATLPTAIAAYSLVGEKVERSLNPSWPHRPAIPTFCWASRWLGWLPRSEPRGSVPRCSW
jgi:hypothetical protein